MKTYSMELLFKALADRTRLRLLSLMGDDEVCVCYFVEVLKTNQPKISRHLAYLRRSGLVVARREGKWMHYRLAPPRTQQQAAILKAALTWAGELPDSQQDAKRFEAACCRNDGFVTVGGAPIPKIAGRCSPGAR